MRLLVGVMLFAAMLATRAAADDEAEADARQSEARLARMRHSATVYEVARGESESALTLLEEPVLRFSNPTSGTKDATLFLWLSEGRPAAAMQVAINRLDETVQEFQSLSTESLSMTRKGKPVWTPAEPGVEFRPVPGAPDPAESAAQRLRQMREFVEAFEVTELAKVDYRDEQRTPYVLRALARPVHRYGDAESEVLDGAVFVYVRGTDAEVLLLLEAREVAGGREWQYALAPMTGYSATAKHGDQEVWSVKERFFTKKPTDGWFATMFGP